MLQYDFLGEAGILILLVDHALDAVRIQALPDVVQRFAGMESPIGVNGGGGIDERVGEAECEVVGVRRECRQCFLRSAEQGQRFDDGGAIRGFVGHGRLK